MRIGLLCRSLGIPLAFPIIYPRLQLPSRASSSSSSSSSSTSSPLLPQRPLCLRALFLVHLLDLTSCGCTSYRTFQLPTGKWRTFSLSFLYMYVCIYIYFFLFLFLILYLFLRVFCFISLISFLRSFNVLLSFFLG